MGTPDYLLARDRDPESLAGNERRKRAAETVAEEQAARYTAVTIRYPELSIRQQEDADNTYSGTTRRKKMDVRWVATK